VGFADGSEIDVREKTEIVVEQRRLQRPTAEGKTIGRRIRVLTGRIISDIRPSGEVLTELLTPAGTAAIRGTRIEIVARRDDAEVALEEGRTEFTFAYGQARWTLDAGDRGRFGFAGRDDRYFVEVLEGDEVPGVVGTTPMRCMPGCHMELRMRRDGIEARLRRGEAFVPDGAGGWRPVEHGEEFDYDAAESLPFDAGPYGLAPAGDDPYGVRSLAYEVWSGWQFGEGIQQGNPSPPASVFQ
jgi:hypothetical protein